MFGRNLAVVKVAELGKPGTPSHSVEFEARVSRREVFRFIVPFLVATIGIDVEKGTDRADEMAPDNK